MSAATCVFETYELLEWTLLHLPLRDLLLAERVCKTWQKLIRKSDKIDKVLFRRPARCSRTLIMPGHATLAADSESSDKSPSSNDLPCYLNPFLNDYVESLEMSIQVKHALISPDENDQANSSAFNNYNASWQRMLLLQPQPLCMPFVCKRLQNRSNFVRLPLFDLRLPLDSRDKGMTMAQICNHLKQHFEECPTCPMLKDIFASDKRESPEWSMWSSAKLPILDLSMPGWSVLEKIEGSQNRA